MTETSIEWTDTTWNPVAGCSVISPGCTNCYAMRMAARLEAMGVGKYTGLTRKSGRRYVWNGKITLDRGSLLAPARWRRPRMVFVNSMSDLFHESVPFQFISEIWSVMQGTPQHTFQILTKRPDRLARATRKLPFLSNAWLGTSVESSDYQFRLDQLRDARAAVRFVSFEPLLGSVSGANLEGIHWAIVGGESGPGARPMEKSWVTEIRASCRSTNTAFFFKQWGGTKKAASGRHLDGKTWDEFPSLSA